MIEEIETTKTTEFRTQQQKVVEENGQENLSEIENSTNSEQKNGVEELVEQQQEQEPGWRRFKQWVHCFCVVTFDLELGQTIEVIYPGNAQLSQSERIDLCYLAFPDSNCSQTAISFSGSSSSPTLSNGHSSRPIKETNLTDSSHHFRIRRTSPNEQIDKFTESIAQQLPPYLRPDGRFFYGFAHFRRQRDPSLARGYSQKSIVLLTHLPFVALFSRVLSEVAMAFFAGGESAIETACRQIGQYWPPPIPGGDRLISLPIFGLRFCCSIPIDSNASSLAEFDLNDDDFEGKKISSAIFPKKQSIEEEEAEFEIIDYLNCNILHLHSIHESDQHFHSGIKRILHHLHLLWELVLLGEPLLILAPNPSVGSSLVHSFISLISPLRYNGDHRPYFTIHDSDFNEISSRKNCLMNSCILGVTNPFFLKAFSHWPHILKLNTIQPQIRRERSESRLVHKLRAQTATQFVLGNLKRSGTASKGLDMEWGENDNNKNGEDEQHQQKMIKRLSDRSLLEKHSSGFLCAHRQFLVQDKTLPRQLLRTPSDSPSQWSALRWYFAELTQSFMSPLESFISTLLPLRRELSPFQPVPQMRPFSLEQFLLSLRHFGHPGVKGDWQGLYRQFVTRSPNFIGWLRQRQKDIERQLRLEHMDLIANFNFTSTILMERNQIEIVDLVMKLTNRLEELNKRLKNNQPQIMGENIQLDGNSSPIKKNFLLNQRLKLQHRFNQILDSVDDELKMVLLSNPTFRRAAEEAEQK